MNAIDLSTPARPHHDAQASKQDDYESAISVSIARSIAVALILATIGLTEWYGCALYGNPLSSQESFRGGETVASFEYLPARYAIQAIEFDAQ